MQFALDSIASLLAAARRTLVRFPETLASALVAAVMAIVLVGEHPAPDRELHLLMAAALGIPLFTALRLFRERPPRNTALLKSWLPLAIGAALLVLYWHLLGRDAGDNRFLRYFHLSLAAHLSVAFAPFLRRGENNGFWQFNRRLFLRAFLSAIYAGAFFCGLAAALAAADHLFQLKLSELTYPRLWLFTVFVFQTWHFLAGVPRDCDALEGDRDHPRGLRIFCQSMLVPLVVLYGAILYTYMGKILLTRQWPDGVVGWMVSAASIFGMLTLLLLEPGRVDAGTRWIRTFESAFYVGVLPLLGLLFAALGKRIGQYAVTERRYILFVLGLWLGAVALFMLLRPSRSIKTVPVSLCLLSLLTSFGPLGAYRFALRSQSQRLESLLSRHGLLRDGRLARSEAAVPAADAKEISGIVLYLVEAHGAGVLARWDARDWGAVAHDAPPWQRPYRTSEAFMDAMGLENFPLWRGSSALIQYRARDDGVDVAGFEWMVSFGYAYAPDAGLPGAPYSARLADEGRAVRVVAGGKDLIDIPLQPLLARLRETAPGDGESIPAADLCQDAGAVAPRVKVCFATLMTRQEKDGTHTAQLGSGFVLIDPGP
jgi:hypothetical protein